MAARAQTSVGANSMLTCAACMQEWVSSRTLRQRPPRRSGAGARVCVLRANRQIEHGVCQQQRGCAHSGSPGLHAPCPCPRLHSTLRRHCIGAARRGQAAALAAEAGLLHASLFPGLAAHACCARASAAARAIAARHPAIGGREMPLARSCCRVYKPSASTFRSSSQLRKWMEEEQCACKRRKRELSAVRRSH